LIVAPVWIAGSERALRLDTPDRIVGAGNVGKTRGWNVVAGRGVAGRMIAKLPRKVK
jgi:hypothetical protein